MSPRAGWRTPSPITLVVVGAVFALVGNLATNTVQVSWRWWPAVVWSVTGFLLATSAVMEAWWRSAAPVAATSARVLEAKDVLAGLVTEQWSAEAALRSLDDPYPIPVHWRLSELDEATDHVTTGSAVEGTSDNIDQLAEAFRALDRRRLVILGGPGTGKTTLALQLVLYLLAFRRDDEPVPVLLSIADWDVQTHSRLQDWLAVRLGQDYPALRATTLGDSAPRILAARSHLLPVLDGLDELPSRARARVIAALNRSMTSANQVILTSRTAEYTDAVREAAAAITSAAVIQPQPLSADVVAGYLRRCLPRRPAPVWEQILAALSAVMATPTAVGALAEITSTPLGLWLVRAVYLAPGADPSVLLDPDRYPTADVLREHLLDRLIPALIATRPPSGDPAEPFRPRRAWEPTQVHRWLGYLAHQLNRTPTTDGRPGTRDFAWWQLARHNLHPGTVRLVAGLMGGLFASFEKGRMAASWAQESPGFADIRITGRIQLLFRLVMAGILGLGLVTGTVVGLVSGLATVLGTSSRSGLAIGLGAGLVVGLVSGSVNGLVNWAETPTPAGRASTPLTNWRADRALNLTRSVTGGFAGGLIIGLMVLIVFGLELTPSLGFTSGIGPASGFRIGLPVGLIFGPVFGLVVWLVFGFGLGLAAGLVLGVVAGLATGLAAGRHHAWIVYVIATARLARAGHLPLRLMRFLDDAHRLGLLRAVGPIYQFRHAELQDHLARTYRQTGRRRGDIPAP
ncbi:MAG TPA: NACHT domain-containing protein [Micromonosporaceae bacterium]